MKTNVWNLAILSFICLIIIFFLDKQKIKSDEKVELTSMEIQKLNSKSIYYLSKGIALKNSKYKKIYKKKDAYLLEPNYKYETEKILLPITNKFNLPQNNYLSFSFVKFNDYQSKLFLKSKVVNKEFLELEKNRVLNLYRGFDKNKFIKIEGDGQKYIEIDSVKISGNSLALLDSLTSNNLFPFSYKAYILTYNPFLQSYELYYDLSFFKSSKIHSNKYIYKLKKPQLKEEKKIRKFKISRDTTFAKSIVIDNKEIIVNQGVSIYFEEGASLLIRESKFNSSGSNFPINWIAKGNNSIVFINCKDISISNNNFYGFSNINDLGFNLPSGITFYNSGISVVKTNFYNNISGDDYVNIFKSNFYLENLKFENTFSDALDIDFSKGIIKTSLFTDIGNDAIDVSGSEIEINKNIIKKCGDKGVSIGENTFSTISENYIIESEIGIVCKDGSICDLSNNKLKNKLDICAFNKKNFYRKPNLKVDQLNDSINYLVEKETIILDSLIKIDIVYTNNVEKLLYGNQYGKSSK